MLYFSQAFMQLASRIAYCAIEYQYQGTRRGQQNLWTYLAGEEEGWANSRNNPVRSDGVQSVQKQRNVHAPKNVEE